MAWLVKNLIGALLMPPCSLILGMVAGLLLWRRRPRIAGMITTFSLVGLILLSMPAVSGRLIAAIEREARPIDPGEPALSARADAIVVLGGGRTLAAREYGSRAAVSTSSLERIRYGAELRRATRKPILVSGGAIGGVGESEAALMSEALRREFGFQPQWIEQKSVDTDENAELSYKILAPLGIKRVFVVTHAWHMPRALRAFRKAGFEAVGAPMRFMSDEAAAFGVLDWVPSARGMTMSSVAFHELLGMAWYRLRGLQ